MKAGVPARPDRSGLSRILAISAAGTVILILGFGIRHGFGLFFQPIAADLSWTRDVFALSLALQNLVWGVSQPFFGILADRFGAARTILLGTALYVIGLVLMAQASSPLAMHLGAGVVIGLALSGVTNAVVLGAVGRRVPESWRPLAFGIVSAGGSLGQFLMVPAGQALIAGSGWQAALLWMAVMAVAMAALGFAFTRRSSLVAEAGSAPAERQSLGEALREARRHRGYILLTAGFFVCGFQVTFITVHFVPFIGDAGLSPAVGATALALVGLFNVFGTMIWGALGGRFLKKLMLALIYLLRSLVIAVFLLLPVTEASVIVFACVMGFLWLGTVPLTSALVGTFFGVRYMSTLFGIVFMSHQFGSFCGTYLGGIVYQRTGSYDLIWHASIALGVVAALLHWPIAERRSGLALSRQPA